MRFGRTFFKSTYILLMPLAFLQKRYDMKSQIHIEYSVDLGGGVIYIKSIDIVNITKAEAPDDLTHTLHTKVDHPLAEMSTKFLLVVSDLRPRSQILKLTFPETLVAKIMLSILGGHVTKVLFQLTMK